MKEGRRAGGKEGLKEGRRAGGKEGLKEGRKEERKEGRRKGREGHTRYCYLRRKLRKIYKERKNYRKSSECNGSEDKIR